MHFDSVSMSVCTCVLKFDPAVTGRARDALAAPPRGNMVACAMMGFLLAADSPINKRSFHTRSLFLSRKFVT
jgi:hypothetical protein